HRRVRAASPRDYRLDSLHHRTLGLDDKLGHHFGIRRGLQHRRRRELLTKLVGVGEVSVMREREVAQLGALEQRLRVYDDRGTGRGITGVSDREVTAEIAQD